MVGLNTLRHSAEKQISSISDRGSVFGFVKFHRLSLFTRRHVYTEIIQMSLFSKSTGVLRVRYIFSSFILYFMIDLTQARQRFPKGRMWPAGSIFPMSGLDDHRDIILFPTSHHSRCDHAGSRKSQTTPRAGWLKCVCFFLPSRPSSNLFSLIVSSCCTTLTIPLSL